MSLMVGSARIDENGKISGGKPWIVNTFSDKFF